MFCWYCIVSSHYNRNLNCFIKQFSFSGHFRSFKLLSLCSEISAFFSISFISLLITFFQQNIQDFEAMYIHKKEFFFLFYIFFIIILQQTDRHFFFLHVTISCTRQNIYNHYYYYYHGPHFFCIHLYFCSMSVLVFISLLFIFLIINE